MFKLSISCEFFAYFMVTVYRKEAKESSAKIKALNDTILRMNEKNVRLTAENKSLKEDLEQLLAQVAETKEKKCELASM